MPRVQGMDTYQRRRPNRGIFSLATPFNQQQQHQHQHAAASTNSNSSPRNHRRIANGRNGNAYDDFDNDGDLEFHGTQTQQDLIVKKKKPSPFAAAAFATKESYAYENNVSRKASSANPATMTANSSDCNTSKNSSERSILILPLAKKQNPVIKI